MKYIYLTILIILGCERKSEENIIKFESSRLSIPISSVMPANPGITQLVETDSGEYVFIYNNYTKAYQFLDFENGESVLEVPVAFEGKDGIGELSGGRLFNHDTIWSLANPSSIILTNFKGEVLIKRNFINSETPVRYVNAFQHKPLINHGNLVFGTQPLFVDHHNMVEDDVKKHRLIFSYDFLEDSVEWYDVFYPDDFWANGKKLAELSWAKRGNKLYIAPWYDHQVQIFDLDTKKVIGRKEVKSEYVADFYYANNLPGNQTEGLLNRLIFDRYESLIYDHHKDIFYRIFLPKMDILDEYSDEKIRDLNWNRPTVGVMVLDTDLSVLGETLFKDYEVFGSYNYFVGREGLYLSANNVFNPEYSEEFLRYILVNFKLTD